MKSQTQIFSENVLTSSITLENMNVITMMTM